MSLRTRLSQFWDKIQYKLLPELEEEFGVLSPRHEKLISILELVRIEHHLPDTRFNDGRPPKDRTEIARAFIAKSFFQCSTVKQLIYFLEKDKQLRMICGWDSVQSIPSESKFSRVFKEFAESKLPDAVHHALVKECYKGEVVFHLSKDSTPLEVREKAIKKEKKVKKTGRKHLKDGELNRRQKQLKEMDLNQMIQDLPTMCDIGRKKNASGHIMTWKGYKLHAAVEDHCIPLAAFVTSASLNDCEVAIPLAIKSNTVTTNLYDLMDAAYDHPEIKEHSISLGHVPVIDKCPNSARQKEEKEAEKERKEALNFETAEDKRYKERFKTERFNALFKDRFGGRTIGYRGFVKVTCAVMFGVLTLAGSLLIDLAK